MRELAQWEFCNRIGRRADGTQICDKLQQLYEFGTDKSDPGQNAHAALPISAATRDFEITLSLVDYI